jgi:hypothetical protein
MDDRVDHVTAAAKAQEELPEPTIWPAALAVGLTATSFGIITSGIFFYAGLIVVFMSIAGWLRDLLAEGPAQEQPQHGAATLE